MTDAHAPTSPAIPQSLDAVIHAPKRLAAMAILNVVKSAEFAYLKERLEIADSDLSKQMRTLVDAGYVSMEKTGGGRAGKTWFKITKAGSAAFDTHRKALRAIVDLEA